MSESFAGWTEIQLENVICDLERHVATCDSKLNKAIDDVNKWRRTKIFHQRGLAEAKFELDKIRGKNPPPPPIIVYGTDIR